MNKTQLVDAVAQACDMSKVSVRKVLDNVVCVTENTLRSGEKVSVTGLGTFITVQSSARVGRNPRTGAMVKIAPKKSVKFRSSIDLEK